VTNVLGRILAICLGLMTACYSPPQPDCGFICGAGGMCPSEYFCAGDGVCHRNGTSSTVSCGADARPDTPKPIDAPADAVDMTPPAVVGTNPMDGATNVPTWAVIRVQFNEAVMGVGSSTFQVSTNSVAIPGQLFMDDTLTYSFTPTSLLPATSTIDVLLTSGIRDTSPFANPLPPTSFSFMTGT
jgi:hypothetical protein